ncbi:MAG TPA: hydrogenase expression/formation protein HypE [Deltaproteobacteria bacterium]|nr:hydrogenase expression/formation protein HypE [Deltaproteobacteria bacterium]
MKKRILLSHGSGGRLSRELVERVFLRHFDNELLAPLDDQAVFGVGASRLAFTTDSYVIDPLFFPGGDIGRLSVCGTVNDLAVGGAEPLYLSAAFIIEEGLELDVLERVVESMAAAARGAGVKVVTGDTKVVERGKGDGLFINTAGVGVVRDGVELSPGRIAPGDRVIVSGALGDHAVAVLTRREGLEMDAPVESDCAPLNGLVAEILDEAGPEVKAMRDPTRGGLATVLNEFAAASGRGVLVREEAVPVREAVRGACEMLGFDPLYLANEGKVVVVAAEEAAERIVGRMRSHELGRDAAVIGEVTAENAGRLIVETCIGNRRIADMLSGEQFPRIC